jgi:hypothetical protein
VEEHHEELLPGCALLFIVVYSKLFPIFENSHIDTWVQVEVPWWVKAGNLKSQASRKQRPINIEHDTVGCLLA